MKIIKRKCSKCKKVRTIRMSDKYLKTMKKLGLEEIASPYICPYCGGKK